MDLLIAVIDWVWRSLEIHAGQLNRSCAVLVDLCELKLSSLSPVMVVPLGNMCSADKLFSVAAFCICRLSAVFLTFLRLPGAEGSQSPQGPSEVAGIGTWAHCSAAGSHYSAMHAGIGSCSGTCEGSQSAYV